MEEGNYYVWRKTVSSMQWDLISILEEDSYDVIQAED